MNKTLIVHVVTETILLLVVGVFMTRKINNVQSEVIVLKQKVAEVEQQNQVLMRHIQQIYSILKSSSAPPAPQQQRRVPPPPAQEPELEYTSFEQEHFKTPTSPTVVAQQAQTPPPNLMETVLNIFPSILPMMSGGGGGNNNSPSIILAEISGKNQPSQSELDVEVMDDDDPDVVEALSEA